MKPWIIEKIRQERQEERRVQLPLYAPDPSDPRPYDHLPPTSESATASVDFEIKT